MNRILVAEDPRAVAAQLKRVPLALLDADSIHTQSVLYRRHRAYKLMKRGGDIAVAAGVLLASLALLPIIALALRLEAPGPVLVRQTSVGPGGKPFNRFTFRTELHPMDGRPRIGIDAHASRMSTVGFFLWRTRLDGLPQAWNVLRGEMSLVGPRSMSPRQLNHAEGSNLATALWADLQPGITGWSQLFLPHPCTDKDRRRVLEYDLYYYSHFGVLLDLSILCQSVRRFAARPLRQAGAPHTI